MLQIHLEAPLRDSEAFLLREMGRELEIALDGGGEGGITLSLTTCGKGFTLTKERERASIAYADMPSLARAFGLLVQHAGEVSFVLSQTPRFSDLFAMIDNARDAVMTVETIQKTCRLLALMGYSSLQLYLEDMFVIEGEPYFGHLRGRFSAAELRACDAYAASLGIELVPCVQTLAHLNGLFRWDRFRPLQDCGDILLAEDEDTYAFLDAMLSTLSSLFRSRRIHIGLDEAQLLGAGRYQQRHGLRSRAEIMLRHLQRVVELCRRYGLRPAMWSDMFFRMQSKNHLYYDMEAAVAPDIAARIPEDVELVYWDYYHQGTAIYDAMFEKHAVFHNPVQFAGGIWKWLGPAPRIRTSLTFSAGALASALAHGVSAVGVTAWNDNGSTCPLFSCLPVWQLYAEFTWTGCASLSAVSERLAACTGLNLEDMLLLDLPNTPPDRGDNPTANPALYLLFQDALLGLYDRHLLPGRCRAHYTAAAGQLERAARRAKASWRYMFRCSAALCRVLSYKAELGVQLKDAYDRQDREDLTDIAERQIPELLSAVEDWHEEVRRQWLCEYKAFGLEVQDIRYGGLYARIRQAGRTVSAYLRREITAIEELEQPRLYRDCRAENSEAPLGLEQYLWHEIASPNIL